VGHQYLLVNYSATGCIATVW